jgi:hypothetical protein
MRSDAPCFFLCRIFFTRTGIHPRLREGHASLENASLFDRIFFTRTGIHPRLREGHASLENASLLDRIFFDQPVST